MSGDVVGYDAPTFAPKLPVTISEDVCQAVAAPASRAVDATHGTPWTLPTMEMASSHQRSQAEVMREAVQREVCTAFGGPDAAYAHLVGSQLYGAALEGADIDIVVELSPDSQE